MVGPLPGWRFAFLSVAFVSILIGALTLWLGTEPRKLRQGAAPKEKVQLQDVQSHMMAVMRVPTFGIIVAQVFFTELALQSPSHISRLLPFSCRLFGCHPSASFRACCLLSSLPVRGSNQGMHVDASNMVLGAGARIRHSM